MTKSFKIMVSRDITVCCLVNRYRHLGGTAVSSYWLARFYRNLDCIYFITTEYLLVEEAS